MVVFGYERKKTLFEQHLGEWIDFYVAAGRVVGKLIDVDRKEYLATLNPYVSVTSTPRGLIKEIVENVRVISTEGFKSLDLTTEKEIRDLCKIVSESDQK